MRNSFSHLFVFFAFWTVTAFGHDGLDLPPPTSVPEAWNVIKLCHANIEKLVTEHQWTEIPIQAALSNQAARFLSEKLGPEPEDAILREKIRGFMDCGIFLVRSSMKRDQTSATRDASTYAAALQTIEPSYPPAQVNAAVYACPMCQGVRELDIKTPCYKCGMQLVPRVIPSSSLYSTPGEPSIVLTPTLERPLAVDQQAEVRIKLARKKDAGPVTLDDLKEVHTQRIHLLIIDEGLTDYHHEHPLPTDLAGEYRFSFTPRRAGPYRIFADVVPRLSSVQEYPRSDLPSAAPAIPPPERQSSTVAEAGGLRFELRWNTGGLPIRAKQPVNASITVTTLDGKPFTQLEPLMGTYAHIVGFHEDRTTVLHIHPTGAEPQKADDRGGPAFNFRFYAPKPGFMRLYGQVQVDGHSVFAPFGLTVAE